MIVIQAIDRHARPCAGHPRLYIAAIWQGVDGRDIGVRKHAVLQTALPGYDEKKA